MLDQLQMSSCHHCVRPLPITIQTGTGHYPKTEAATCQRHSQQANYFIRHKRTIPFVAPTWGPRKHHLNERIPQTRSWLLGEYLLSGMPGKDTLFGDADTNVPIDSSPQHESTQSGLIHAITLIQHSRQTMIRHQFSAFSYLRAMLAQPSSNFLYSANYFAQFTLLCNSARDHQKENLRNFPQI